MQGQDKDLWRRCQEVAEALPLPIPFQPEEFVAALSRQRGRPIELVPVTVQACTPCGMLVSTDRADYIGYPVNTTELHQQHILLHEVAHLLCGHVGADAFNTSVVRALMPHLSGELVQRVLGRTVHSEAQEQEAELLASLILQRAAHGAETAPPLTPEGADAVARLRSVFGSPARPRRRRG